MNTSTFDLAAHDDHIRRHGELVEWRAASKCACTRSVDANRADPNCALCSGTGTLYAAPVRFVAMLVGIRHEKSLVEIGLAIPGDMVMSQSPFDENTVGEYDLIRTTWDEAAPYEGDLVTRGPGASDRVKFGIGGVVRLHSVDRTPTGNVAHDWAQGTDYSFSGDTITWVDGHGPTEGQTYSVRYDVASYDWVAFVPPSQRIERGTSLGRKTLLRKRDVARAK